MNTTTKSIRTWKNKEGNLCFSYNMKQPMEKPLIMAVIYHPTLSRVGITYVYN